MLSPGFALKPDPLIVTVVPIGPDCGEKELIVGCAYTEAQKKSGSTNKYLRLLSVWLYRFIIGQG
jgi:hypothetical protein